MLYLQKLGTVHKLCQSNSMWQQFYELAPQPLVSISIFKPIWQKAFQCYSRPDSKHLVLFSPKRRRSPSGNYDKVCSRQLVPDCPLAILGIFSSVRKWTCVVFNISPNCGQWPFEFVGAIIKNIPRVQNSPWHHNTKVSFYLCLYVFFVFSSRHHCVCKCRVSSLKSHPF